MSNTSNATTTTTCTCRYPGDCCPKCYEEQKAELQQQLWAAIHAKHRLEAAVLKLEERRAQHES